MSPPPLFKSAYRAALGAFFLVWGLYALEYPVQGTAIAALLFLLYLMLSLPGADAHQDGEPAGPEGEATAGAFQKRRRLFLLFGYYPLVFGAAAVLLLALLEALLGADASVVFLFQETPLRFLLFGATFGGLGITWTLYRCPICGAVPLRPVKKRKRGAGAIDINPTRCRRCGARLK